MDGGNGRGVVGFLTPFQVFLGLSRRYSWLNFFFFLFVEYVKFVSICTKGMLRRVNP